MIGTYPIFTPRFWTQCLREVFISAPNLHQQSSDERYVRSVARFSAFAISTFARLYSDLTLNTHITLIFSHHTHHISSYLIIVFHSLAGQPIALATTLIPWALQSSMCGPCATGILRSSGFHGKKTGDPLVNIQKTMEKHRFQLFRLGHVQ